MPADLFRSSVPFPFILNIVEGWADKGRQSRRPPCYNTPQPQRKISPARPPAGIIRDNGEGT